MLLCTTGSKKIISILTRTMMTTTSLRKGVIHHSVTPPLHPFLTFRPAPAITKCQKSKQDFSYLCPAFCSKIDKKALFDYFISGVTQDKDSWAMAMTI